MMLGVLAGDFHHLEGLNVVDLGARLLFGLEAVHDIGLGDLP